MGSGEGTPYIPSSKSFAHVQIPLWLLSRSPDEISFAAKCCFAYLTLAAGKNGQCFPSHERIAEYIGYTGKNKRKRASKLISELENLGLIKIVKKTGENNRYIFLPHRWIKLSTLGLNRGHDQGSYEGRHQGSYEGMTRAHMSPLIYKENTNIIYNKNVRARGKKIVDISFCENSNARCSFISDDDYFLNLRYAAKIVICYLRKRAVTADEISDKNIETIIKHLLRGVTVLECWIIIERKIREFNSPELRKYLCLDTLFKTKFDKYLAEVRTEALRSNTRNLYDKTRFNFKN